MRKFLFVVVALIAALGMMSQSAEAAKKKAKVVVTPSPWAWTWPWTVHDPRLAGSNFVVGAGATGLYYGLRGGHNGTRHGWHSSGAAYAGASIACAAASPIIGTLVVNRQLTRREVLVSTANCALPIIGGWMVNAWIDNHPEWE
ncbi:MAG: hypothetical protein HY659_08050 [Rhizobiales bacterium]|nr:hypothetical protein [Hyphomicrobiales bacterium]